MVWGNNEEGGESSSSPPPFYGPIPSPFFYSRIWQAKNFQNSPFPAQQKVLGTSPLVHLTLSFPAKFSSSSRLVIFSKEWSPQIAFISFPFLCDGLMWIFGLLSRLKYYPLARSDWNHSSFLDFVKDGKGENELMSYQKTLILIFANIKDFNENLPRKKCNSWCTDPLTIRPQNGWKESVNYEMKTSYLSEHSKTPFLIEMNNRLIGREYFGVGHNIGKIDQNDKNYL